MTHYFDGFTQDIECKKCVGTGEVYNSHDCMKDCPDCDGLGWRPMTQDEIEDAAADAFSDMCEGEPPLSADEHYRMAAEQKRRLRP